MNSRRREAKQLGVTVKQKVFQDVLVMK